jgi:hypothetical protein
VRPSSANHAATWREKQWVSSSTPVIARRAYPEPSSRSQLEAVLEIRVHERERMPIG